MPEPSDDYAADDAADDAGDYAADDAGKNGIVFGASSLLGKWIASALAQRGVNLCLLDLERHSDDGLGNAVRGPGSDGKVIHKTVASGDEDGFETALAQAADALGRLDYLLCMHYLEELAEMLDSDDLSLDSWDHLLQDWVMNTFLVARAAFPYMTREGRGRVVFFNTTTGYTGEGQGEGDVTVEGSIHECACSSAITGVMTSIARDIIPLGIAVNGIALGPHYADDMDRVIWATDFWLSGVCDYACGQILRLY